MERMRKSKLIIAIILVITILGVSLGFAAFSNNLTISSSADVSLENSLRVYFSSSKNEQSTIVGEDNIYLSETYPGFTASIPVLDNSVETAPVMSNLKATFVRPGEAVTYTFYVHNASDYAIQLTDIIFGTKNCRAKEGTNQDLVNNACNEIDLSITVGEDNAVTKTQNTSLDSAVVDHVLAAGAYETLSIVLSYERLTGGVDNSSVNGDFEVIFGDVKLTYSSSTTD